MKTGMLFIAYDKIIKYTGMTLEEIQELREELAKEFQA